MKTPMTAGELIEKLQTVRQDRFVIFEFEEDTEDDDRISWTIDAVTDIGGFIRLTSTK